MNKVIFKSPEFYRLAKELSKCQNQLNKSRIDQEKSGYVMDQWGSFVSQAKISKLFEVLQQLMEVDEPDEARAAHSMYAGALLTLNRFDEAEAEFKALAQRNPNKNAWDIFNLVIIAAKRGNFEEARRLAAILDAIPDNLYRMPEERIQEEYEGYRKIAKV